MNLKSAKVYLSGGLHVLTHRTTERIKSSWCNHLTVIAVIEVRKTLDKKHVCFLQKQTVNVKQVFTSLTDQIKHLNNGYFDWNWFLQIDVTWFIF